MKNDAEANAIQMQPTSRRQQQSSAAVNPIPKQADAGEKAGVKRMYDINDQVHVVEQWWTDLQ